MDFALWLVVCKPSGKRINTRTARKYVSQVVNWMRRVYRADFAGGLDLVNLRDMLKGVRRELGEAPPRPRYGVRTQDLREALNRFLPKGSSRDAQMWRAALSSAFCGLLRGCEVGLPEGVAFDSAEHLTRKDVQFRTRPDGKRLAILTIRLAKSGQLTGKTVPVFLVGGGTLVDPVAELERMLADDPVAEQQQAVTPLFRCSNGDAITRAQVGRMVKELMGRLGRDPARFGAHSLRIGGATAALAAGVHPSVIRITGRWMSEVWMIYARLSKQAALQVSAVVGSTPFEDLERGEFVSEELELLPEERRDLGDVDIGVDGHADGSSEDEA